MKQTLKLTLKQLILPFGILVTSSLFYYIYKRKSKVVDDKSPVKDNNNVDTNNNIIGNNDNFVIDINDANDVVTDTNVATDINDVVNDTNVANDTNVVTDKDVANDTNDVVTDKDVVTNQEIDNVVYKKNIEEILENVLNDVLGKHIFVYLTSNTGYNVCLEISTHNIEVDKQNIMEEILRKTTLDKETLKNDKLYFWINDAYEPMVYFTYNFKTYNIIASEFSSYLTNYLETFHLIDYYSNPSMITIF